jgi:hypothetical protein
MSQVVLKKEQQNNIEAAEFVRKLSLIAVQNLNLQGYYAFMDRTPKSFLKNPIRFQTKNCAQ